MIKTLLLVGLGGFLGSVSRYLTSLVFTRFWPINMPLGTFAANVLGCFLIGIAYGLSLKLGWFNPQWRLFFITGFCGGYTTFSSFAYENVKLLQSGQYGLFGGYVLLSVALGLLAVFGGLLITKI